MSVPSRLAPECPVSLAPGGAEEVWSLGRLSPAAIFRKSSLGERIGERSCRCRDAAPFVLQSRSAYSWQYR
jgi:hypothetical protein